MLMTVGELKRRVNDDMSGLVATLQDETGRSGQEEADSWRASLPALVDILSSTTLDPVHVFFRGSGHAALEYQLPAASSWCDVVLLGARLGKPAALVLELKHWHLAGDTPGPAEGLMLRSGQMHLHPSRQVGNYTEYIRRFHSEIVSREAAVNGCVVFTQSGNADSYMQAPNQSLTSAYPVFTTNTADVTRRFPEFATQLLSEPAPEFAEAFVNGSYRQDRGFVKQIGGQLLDPASDTFVLLDRQDEAFLLCRERIKRLIDGKDGFDKRRVVIVHGPPGSGKSVVAAKLWASIVTDPALKEGNVVITTTSSSQNSNWVHLVNRAARAAGAGGIVKKATSYHPISTTTFGRLRRTHGETLFSDAAEWREHVKTLRALHPFQTGARDNEHLVSLVDEAHALINPEHVEGRGNYGFATGLGPQAFHIMRTSRLSVFFMDRDQGYRERENTRVGDLLLWAKELGASVDQIDLSGAQFRCAGSKEYMDWIEVIRSNTHPQIAARHAKRWRESDIRRSTAHGNLRVAEPAPRYGERASGMQFEIVASPSILERRLREKLAAGYSARILSSYNRPWKTKDAPAPHLLPAELQDFAIAHEDDGRSLLWARPWNFVPKGSDYTHYVQAVPGSHMATDPLCEIGCPYAVRGFDFDYVGLIWGHDLVWRTDQWIVQPEFVHETGTANLARRAKRSAPGSSDRQELLKRVWQGYRILLSRAMRGQVLFVEDDETRAYLKIAAA